MKLYNQIVGSYFIKSIHTGSMKIVYSVNFCYFSYKKVHFIVAPAHWDDAFLPWDETIRPIEPLNKTQSFWFIEKLCKIHFCSSIAWFNRILSCFCHFLSNLAILFIVLIGLEEKIIFVAPFKFVSPQGFVGASFCGTVFSLFERFCTEKSKNA